MRYISTRETKPGGGAPLSFCDVLLAGLAPDGGLYVPERWPDLGPATIAGFQGKPYTDVALEVMTPFVGGDIPHDDFAAMIRQAYAGFDHQAVVPLVQLSEQFWLLELFHGPTLAFKDVAMQLLGPLFEYVLAQRGQRLTIVGATSGDTGSAAIEAMRGRDAVDIFILHPHNRTSEIQRRQMTTVSDDNVHNIAIEGTFDDCQALVKEMFADQSFRTEMQLGGVNSINWARVMAQTVYYFTSAVALGAPGREVAFCVPTGNFGDILAGYVAKRMGIPIADLRIATNMNDILCRALTSGRYEVAEVQATHSPSMDIQVSSNFERLLFDVYDRDAAAVNTLMAGLKQGGAFTIADASLKRIRADFSAARVTEDETRALIRETYLACGALVDPHTAVGLGAARQMHLEASCPIVTLATASPAKFPDVVSQAAGVRPVLPQRLDDLFDRDEKFTVLDNDIDAVKAAVRRLRR